MCHEDIRPMLPTLVHESQPYNWKMPGTFFPTLQYSSPTRTHAMVVYNQSQLDAAFDDMDVLLSAERPIPANGRDTCVNCGAGRFVFNGQESAHPGSRICDLCGVVDPGLVIWETMYGNLMPTKTSNYKRIHHWHERISQLLLAESRIPDDEMLQIARCICSGEYTVINKDVIRTVLRSLNMQLYIEKWLQIIFRITKTFLLVRFLNKETPTPGIKANSFLELQNKYLAPLKYSVKSFANKSPIPGI